MEDKYTLNVIRTISLLHQKFDAVGERTQIPQSINDELLRFLNLRGIDPNKINSLGPDPSLIPNDEKPVEFVFWFSLALAARPHYETKLFLDFHSKQYIPDNYSDWLENDILSFLSKVNFIETSQILSEVAQWIRENREKHIKNTDSSFLSRYHQELITFLKDYVSLEQHIAIEQLIFKNKQPQKAIAIQGLNKTDFGRLFYFLKTRGGFHKTNNPEVANWISNNFVQFNKKESQYVRYSVEYLISILKGNRAGSSKLKDPFTP